MYTIRLQSRFLVILSEMLMFSQNRTKCSPNIEKKIKEINKKYTPYRQDVTLMKKKLFWFMLLISDFCLWHESPLIPSLPSPLLCSHHAYTVFSSRGKVQKALLTPLAMDAKQQRFSLWFWGKLYILKASESIIKIKINHRREEDGLLLWTLCADLPLLCAAGKMFFSVWTLLLTC